MALLETIGLNNLELKSFHGESFLAAGLFCNIFNYFLSKFT